ncbi:MAG: hypothetical protein IT467_02620 [Dokdonella sp.]|uniref:exosortase H-associated membrane protein n=1 Tax=Dokdonella sp. TaxID=2291710 RepID=UPI0025C72E03|nr:exosortase H-associated membrane protein [Dokdonella sp.]MBZ0223773.1 hypothetical protein [Dokdonella sp.]MCC7254805.1 hypothetical protein [Dokdonella sp.]
MAASPVRGFALRALLWLPLAFVLWLAWAPLWVLPAMHLAKLALLGFWGGLFENLTLGGELLDAAGRVVARSSYFVTVTTHVQVTVAASGGHAGGVGVLEPTLNPMVYAWSLPLFAGLAMATPITAGRRALQFLVAFALIWLTQAFGICAESLKVLAYQSGSEGAAAIAAAGLSPAAIGIAYQFAVLILPAVIPVLLWVAFNRAFIEQLVGREREPQAHAEGHSEAGPPTSPT